MRIALSSPVRTRAFLGGCAGLISFCFGLSLQAVIEQHLAAHPTMQNVTRLERIQPLNADYEAALGAISMESGQFQQAGVHLERAARINPHSAHIWLMLANAYEVLGDDARRGAAVREAIAAEPKNTAVQWEAANLFLPTDLDRSLQLLRGVVQNDPKYATAAMQVAYRASGQNVEKAMLAIPLETASRVLFMHWLINRGDWGAADHVWPTVLRAPGDLQARDIFFYIDSLIGRHRAEQARAAWLSLADRDPSLRAQLQPGNLVFNGDFEGDLLNGGFGWRYTPTTGVTASLDTSTFHGGTRSLALQIDGENLQDLGFRQYVRLEPGRYHLSAWFHAEELEAAHGVRFVIEDAYSHTQVFLSEEELGSFAWREFDADFTVRANTELATIALVRSPSDGLIRGKLWLDDLRIEKQ